MSRAVPTREQLEWADCELGAIFHYDITVFEQDYRFRRSWGYQPSPQIFAPDALDTDQWIRAVAKAGVRYAVLVAKHCTGFALFPSSANPYHVGNSPYGEDIVKSFVESCKKYGIKPGVYYSTVCNAYENVDNPGLVRTKDAGDQKHYNKVVETQLTELWSRYGEWFEIWFDGGTLSVEKGGLPIAPLLLRYQPNAITFQGDKLKKKNNLRWVGKGRAEEGRDLALGDKVEQQRTQTCAEQGGRNAQTGEQGDQHGGTKHGEHMLDTQDQHPSGTQLAGVVNALGVINILTHYFLLLSAAQKKRHYRGKAAMPQKSGPNRKRKIQPMRAKDDFFFSISLSPFLSFFGIV